MTPRPGLYERLMMARAFLWALSVQKRLKTRADVERWQARRLNAFLKRAAPRVDAFEAFRGTPLSGFPFMDKAVLMSDFHRFNRLGLTADEAWRQFGKGEAPTGHAIGASTGTSGNRGLYLISNKERFLWLGVILAKALPDVIRRRHRIAVILPANSRLYDAANESGRLSLKFFDLSVGIDPVLPEVATFDPSVIIAPPKVLRALAESGLPCAPEQVFSGAEVLDPVDRVVIEARFGRPVREIYMATEGLLGVACAHGTLHLAEDMVAFEWENDPAGGPLRMPVITDFTRRTQIMLRYRMNDLLELSGDTCPCGSPLQTVRSIAGRADDVFELTASNGSSQRVRITPDVIRNAVLGSDRRIGDFRVIQTGPGDVTLALPPQAAECTETARQALDQLFRGAGAGPAITLRLEPLASEGHRKLRRVMRLPEPSE